MTHLLFLFVLSLSTYIGTYGQDSYSIDSLEGYSFDDDSIFDSTNTSSEGSGFDDDSTFYSTDDSTDTSSEDFSFDESIVVLTDTSPEVKQTKLHVTSLITTRYVETTVEAVYENRAKETKEVTFRFILTPQAYVSGFTIVIDGDPYYSNVTDNRTVKTTFKEANRREQSAGYAIQRGSPLNFLVNLNVTCESTVTFWLHYDELLRSGNDEFTHRINLAPGQIVDDFEVEVFIMEPQIIKSLKGYWVRQNADLQTSIHRNFQESMRTGSIRFNPLADQQRRVDAEDGINGIFVVKYDLVHRPLEGNVEINDRHFAHFISPVEVLPVPKKVIFVMDVSGSMGGTKLSQTKTSLNAIVRQLREGDNFNILKFSSTVNAWKDRAVPATRRMIEEAIDFVDGFIADGGTNIYDALVGAATEFDDDISTFHAIIFMTDGLPSEGITNSDVILESVTNAIDGNAVLFSFGFGENVDELLLERLSVHNGGKYKRVSEGENAASVMKGFFQEAASALLININVTYDNRAVPTETLTQNYFASISEGREIIIAGEINDDYDGSALNGLLRARAAQDILELPILKNITEFPSMPNMVLENTEKIWAYIKIKELLQQEHLEVSNQRKAMLRHEALALSLEYHLVTPLTALLFYIPYDVRDGYSDPETYHDYSAAACGDPHFVIDIPNTNLTVCFDVHGEEGTIVNLLTDPRLDILVNAKMGLFIMNGNKSKNATQNTLFNRFGVKLGHHTVVIAHFQVLVDSEMSYSWKKKTNIILGKYNIAIRGKGLVTISHGDDIVMNFQRHIWKDHPAHFDFFLAKGKGFSNELHGIVGQFQGKSMKIVDDSRRTNTGLVQGVMNVGKKEAYVYHHTNFSNRGYSCWWARPDVYLDGKIEHYIVPKLFDYMPRPLDEK